MEFDFNDTQREIKATAHDFLASRFRPEKVRELAESESPYDDQLWEQICELGWPGIAVAEQYGGLGLGTVELVILLEELGYACAPAPLISNAIAGLAIETAGSDEQRQRWLPGIASGKARGAAELTADPEPVVGAAGGSAVLVLADGDGAKLIETESATLERLNLIDTTRAYYRVRTEGGEPCRETCSRRSTGPRSRSPPSWSGSRSERSRWRSPTPGSGSSSGARSAPIRRSRTGSRTCSGRSRRRAR